MDRNTNFFPANLFDLPSLSARRAWIEMALPELIPLADPVALRKESVDRNSENPMISIDKISSLSARRAWIEIIDNLTQGVFNLVALRKESVDRNGGLVSVVRFATCRSPQGERG